MWEINVFSAIDTGDDISHKKIANLKIVIAPAVSIRSE
jgi:hypothetical protein